MQDRTAFRQVIDKVVALYKTAFWPSAAALFLPSLLVIVPIIYILWQADGFNLATATGQEILDQFSLTSMAVLSLMIVITSFLVLYASAGLTKLSIEFLNSGKAFGFKAIYKAATKKLIWKYFIVSLAVGLMVVGGLILLIIPGVLFMLRYSVAVPLALDKNLETGQALKKSRQMTKGFYPLILKLIGAYILLSILTIIPYLEYVLTFAIYPLSVFGPVALYKYLNEQKTA